MSLYPNDGTLKAHYAGENANVLDDGIGANDLTATGSVTSTTGQVGNAITIPGGTIGGAQGWATIPAAVVAGITAAGQGMTVSCWYRVAGFNNWAPVFAFMTAGDAEHIVFMPYTALTNNVARTEWRSGGSNLTLDETGASNAPALNTWYYVAVVQSPKNQRLLVYHGFGVNDLRVFRVDSTKVLADYTTLHVGRLPWGVSGDPLFNGKIDELTIAGRAWSEAEVRQVWNNHAGRNLASLQGIGEVTKGGSPAAGVVPAFGTPNRNSRGIKLVGNVGRIRVPSGRVYPRPE